jgi:hypothetical protein
MGQTFDSWILTLPNVSTMLNHPGYGFATPMRGSVSDLPKSTPSFFSGLRPFANGHRPE